MKFCTLAVCAKAPVRRKKEMAKENNLERTVLFSIVFMAYIITNVAKISMNLQQFSNLAI